jgi:hypothetical protein
MFNLSLAIVIPPPRLIKTDNKNADTHLLNTRYQEERDRRIIYAGRNDNSCSCKKSDSAKNALRTLHNNTVKKNVNNA